jgi:hypothetical protein
MAKLPHLFSRVFFSLLFIAIGIASIGEGMAQQLYGRTVCGIALILMGLHSFLAPINLRAPLRDILSTTQAGAIGPAGLRNGLVFATMALLFLGLILRWVFKV